MTAKRKAGSPRTLPVYIDFAPNQPRTDAMRRAFATMLRARFEDGLAASVERIWDLPQVLVLQSEDPYLALLREARALYVAGYFYACVTMCGVVGERLMKDLLVDSLLLRHPKGAVVLTEAPRKRLERMEAEAVRRFLKDAGLLNEKAAKAAEALIVLRNDYAHAIGKKPLDDAKKALALLDELVADTASLLASFDVDNGQLVPKKRPSP